jgi:hypothetical protein
LLDKCREQGGELGRAHCSDCGTPLGGEIDVVNVEDGDVGYAT